MFDIFRYKALFLVVFMFLGLAPCVYGEVEVYESKSSLQLSILAQDGTISFVGIKEVPIRTDYRRENLYHGRFFHGKILSFNGRALGYFRANNINPHPMRCWDKIVPNSISGGCEKIKKLRTEVFIPNLAEAERVIFYDEKGIKIFEINIKKHR